MRAKTLIQMVWIRQNLADEHSVQADALLTKRVDDRRVGVASLEEQMLVELVDEVALDGLERLVHSIEYQVVPIRGQAHEFAEAAWVVSYESEGDQSIEQCRASSELHSSSNGDN